MNKDTYIVFGEWEDNLVDLTQREKGDILDALFGYWRRGEKPVFSDRALRNVWRPMETAIDRMNEAYEAQCEVNRENGKKGGAPIGNQNARKYPKTTKTTETTETSETTLPDPYPEPKPNRNPNLKKTKFHNFDERNYSAEQMDAIEKKLMGGQ